MSQDNLAYVKEHLLHAAGVDESSIAAALALLTERKLDFGDLFFEHNEVKSIVLEKTAVFDRDKGINQ